MSTNKYIVILAILLMALPLVFPVGYGYGYPSTSGGGETHTKPKVTVGIQILCNGTTITVTGDKGEPIPSTILISTPSAVYVLQDTDANGILTVPTGQIPCGSNGVSVLANPQVSFRDQYDSKTLYYDFTCPTNCGQTACTSGQELVSGACVAKCPSGESRVNGQCVECTSDSQCKDGKICQGNKCVEKNPPPATTCTAPGCCKSDAECGAGNYCQMTAAAAAAVTGTCEPIVCGQVVNHQLVPYACGTEPGCNQCSAPQVCEQHTCHLYQVQCPATGKVGAAETCTLTKDGAPCSVCNGTMTDPAGNVVPFTTDAKGQFTFTPTKAGLYKVVSSGNPGAPGTVTVSSSTPPTTTPPTYQGPSIGVMTLIALLIILLLAGLYWFFMRRKGGKK